MSDELDHQGAMAPERAGEVAYDAGDAVAYEAGREHEGGHEHGHGHGHEHEDGHEAAWQARREAGQEAEYETEYAAEGAGALAADFDADDLPDGLDAVPVTVGFELGRVALPLAELRTLGAGAVVQFDGGSPAAVAIVSGGTTLGRGEIVDVEGRLGIRVTHWGAAC
ncbi:FliM/FliN family flagellar motor switch protein [Duganella radicis]|nr:FliM/FliN family flagellar motor switch protein [Duganella radicis]